MQTQSETRVKKRIHCTLNHETRHQTGLILNLSRGGLFVQTTQPAEPGARIAIDFIDPASSQPIELQTRVVWRRRISQRMTGLNQSGMGLRLLEMPPEYQQLVDTSLHPVPRDELPGKSEATIESGPQHNFLVRLGQSGGPRSRRMEVTCGDIGAARREALERAGSGWDVLEVTLRPERETG